MFRGRGDGILHLRGVKKRKPRARAKRIDEENWEDVADAGERATSFEPSIPEVLDGPTGIVIGISSGRCRVVFEENEIDALVPPELALRQKSLLAVGDRVSVDQEGEHWRVRGVMPRHSVLARPDPHDPTRQRLIAANIDVVIHVVSVKAPPLRPRLIDRFLIAIQRGGAQPLLCVNKIDLLAADERDAELAKVSVYRDLGLPIIACSTKTGEGLDALRDAVRQKTAALVGHSGVGKSSILNALDERLQIVTNTLHRRGTGRHTTTSATLHDFGDGTYLIDTPGIREFGLWDLNRTSLRQFFPEFDEPAESCRFTDCTHVHEPGCEVKERAEAGTLNRARYDAYHRLYDDLKK